MNLDNVIFKGTKEAIIIVINEHIGMDQILDELEEKLKASVRFLKGINYPVKIRGREFSDEEFMLIAKKVREIVGIDIEKEEKVDEEQQISEVYVDEVEEKETSKNENYQKYCSEEVGKGATKFHRGTLRSGQLITFDGNVVIIGDVNPGSKVVASGNIVVFGLARGILHAGVGGNKDSIVVALALNPTQLRISDVITRSPDGKIQSQEQLPEIAYIRDEHIYIEQICR